MEEVAEKTIKEDKSLLKPQETGFYAKGSVEPVVDESIERSSSSSEKDTERRQSDNEDRIMPVAEDRDVKADDKLDEPAPDKVS